MQFLFTKCNFVLRNAISFYEMQFCSTKCNSVLRNAISNYENQFRSTKCNFVLRNSIPFYEMQFRSTKFRFCPRNLNFVHEIRSFYTWHPVVGVCIYTFLMIQGFSVALKLQIGVLKTPEGSVRA